MAASVLNMHIHTNSDVVLSSTYNDGDAGLSSGETAQLKQCKSEDIINLIDYIKQEVKKHYDIDLVLEQEIIK